MKNASFLRRMGYAVAGLRVVWRREKSFRTQCLMALGAIVVTVALRPGWAWAAMIGLCIAFVLALELANAALEYLIDHLHPGIADEIKYAKDAAAGAVLLASIGSAVVGALMVADTFAG